MNERTETRVMFLGAVALALFGIFAPYRWHDLPGWLTNLALQFALFLALWAAGIWLPGPAKGIKKSMAALLIAGGACALITGVVLWLDASPGGAESAANEFIYFDVDLSAPNAAGAYPGRIINRAPSTFFNVIAWFSPESAKGNADRPDGAYWSLRPLQVGFPVLHTGGPRTGKFIPLGYYFVQCNATYNDISYYFRELLQIREYDGSVIQLIDVWKISPDGKQTKVYTSDRPNELKDDRQPF